MAFFSVADFFLRRWKNQEKKDVQKSVTKLFNTLLATTTISFHTFPLRFLQKKVQNVSVSPSLPLCPSVAFLSTFFPASQSRGENFSVSVFAAAEIADLRGAENISLLASIFLPAREKSVAYFSRCLWHFYHRASVDALWPRKRASKAKEIQTGEKIFQFRELLALRDPQKNVDIFL